MGKAVSHGIVVEGCDWKMGSLFKDSPVKLYNYSVINSNVLSLLTIVLVPSPGATTK
jgi:hypothetical protein